MNLINFSYFLSGVMLMMTMIGLVVSAILPVLDHWNKRYFIVFFSVLLLLTAACFIDLLVFMDPGQIPAEKIAVFFEGLFLAVLAILPALYVIHYCGEIWRNSPLFYAEITLLGVFFVLLVYAQFTPFIYQVSPESLFTRGPGFPLLILPVVVMNVIGIVAVIRRRKKLSKKLLIAFLLYMVPMMVALLIHSFLFVFLFVDLCILVFAFTMFCIILSEQVEQNRIQQKEIEQQQAHIMVLQMRPHFIYNSLTSIYYLCEQDPKKAQQVIMDFTTYLRKNFSAISGEETISFPEELAHTQAYLAVEQALHEDLLFIDYDTSYTRFRLPPLTLQPVVENAIKHGLDPDAEPLHISIRTCKTDSGTELIVSNNGIGFDPPEEIDPNTALSNIRQRLEMMCGGEMSITSSKEGETVVKIVIPSPND